MTGTSCQTGGREEEETLSRFFVVSFLLLPSCLPPPTTTRTLGSPSSLFPTSLNAASSSPPSSSGLCLAVTLCISLSVVYVTFDVSNTNLQDKYEASKVFFAMSQAPRYKILQMSNEQTSYCESIARLSQTYREHCLVRRG